MNIEKYTPDELAGLLNFVTTTLANDSLNYAGLPGNIRGEAKILLAGLRKLRHNLELDVEMAKLPGAPGVADPPGIGHYKKHRVDSPEIGTRLRPPVPCDACSGTGVDHAGGDCGKCSATGALCATCLGTKMVPAGYIKRRCPDCSGIPVRKAVSP